MQDSRQAAALRARYGATEAPASGPWSDVIEQLLSHRSVRAFLPDALPEGTLATLLAAAQSAATSSNLQTWSVISVSDPERRARFAKIAANQRHIVDCPLFLVWIADVSRLERIGTVKQTEIAAVPFLETFLTAAIDVSLAAQNAVVAAESLGLSTVYIGAMRNDIEAVGADLNLPPGAMGVFGLCVGYADPSVPAEVKPRLPPRVVLHHERYDATPELERIPAYDAELAAFSARNGMGATNWTDRVIARTSTIRALMGRDRMTAALRAMGFPLK